MTMKIYIITHKNFNERYDANVYYPLLVGANKNSCDIAKVKDNTGDNISNENPYFCELTGLYWIWKNVSEDIVGVCHYRRFFTKNRYIFCNRFERLYPEYINDVNWFEQEKIGYCYNMMISKKEIFDQYCEWLFSILFEVEKQIDISNYDSYNKRVYGFLSERLINVWVHHQGLKVKEVPVYMTDLKFCTRVKNKIRNVRGKLCTII